MSTKQEVNTARTLLIKELIFVIIVLAAIIYADFSLVIHILENGFTGGSILGAAAMTFASWSVTANAVHAIGYRIWCWRAVTGRHKSITGS